MDDLTENKDGGVIAQDTQQGTALVIVNNRVVLPKTRTVTLESKRFHALVRRTVPAVAPELIEALKAKQERPSRLSRLGLFVGLAALFAVVLLLWPRNTPLLDTTLTYEIPTLTSDKVDIKYRSVLQNCDVWMSQKEYTACAACLKEPVETILQDGTLFLDNARLLAMYLDCMLNNTLSKPDGVPLNEMRNLCLKAQKYSDSPEWMYYELFFWWSLRKPRLDEFKKGSRLVDLKKKEVRDRMSSDLLALYKRAGEVNSSIAQRPEAKVLQKSLDRILCEILIARWLVDGYPKYPDDFGDPGVAFREEAYKIAKRYGDDIVFLEMQREIAQKVMRRISFFNKGYFFDRRGHEGPDHLDSVIEDINNCINKQLSQEGTR